MANWVDRQMLHRAESRKKHDNGEKKETERYRTPNELQGHQSQSLISLANSTHATLPNNNRTPRLVGVPRIKLSLV